MADKIDILSVYKEQVLNILKKILKIMWWFNKRSPVLGICSYCRKYVHREFRNKKPTWIITEKGIYHRSCYIQLRGGYKK